jgi:hypothetical protein
MRRRGTRTRRESYRQSCLKRNIRLQQPSGEEAKKGIKSTDFNLLSSCRDLAWPIPISKQGFKRPKNT